MKTSLTPEGNLLIKPENELEKFVLSHLSKECESVKLDKPKPPKRYIGFNRESATKSVHNSN